jgi:hypothetical protein
LGHVPSSTLGQPMRRNMRHSYLFSARVRLAKRAQAEEAQRRTSFHGIRDRSDGGGLEVVQRVEQAHYRGPRVKANRVLQNTLSRSMLDPIKSCRLASPAASQTPTKVREPRGRQLSLGVVPDSPAQRTSPTDSRPP